MNHFSLREYAADALQDKTCKVVKYEQDNSYEVTFFETLVIQVREGERIEIKRTCKKSLLKGNEHVSV